MATREEVKFPNEIEKQILKRKEKKSAEQPIEILLELVSEGEIDPWDFDIVKVADKFLEKVEILEKKDLKVTAKTLYAASMLLRKKSDQLVEEDEEKEEQENEWQPQVYDPRNQEPPKLELPVRRESKRPATVIELMDELKKALRQEKNKKRKQKLEDKKEKEDEERVKNLAHEEKIEKQIEETYNQIKKAWRKKKKIKFSDLIKIKTRSKIIEKYLSILFLANRDKIRLEQKKPYGEILISSQNPPN